MWLCPLSLAFLVKKTGSASFSDPGGSRCVDAVQLLHHIEDLRLVQADVRVLGRSLNWDVSLLDRLVELLVDQIVHVALLLELRQIALKVTRGEGVVDVIVDPRSAVDLRIEIWIVLRPEDPALLLQLFNLLRCCHYVLFVSRAII